MDRTPTKMLEGLTPGERTVVQVLSVFNEPVPITTIARALGKAGHRVDGRSPRNNEALPLLHGLIRRGWVTGEGQFRVAEERVHDILLAAAREGTLPHMAEVVRELRPIRSGPDQPFYDWDLGLRELRIELYSQRWEAARALLPEAPAEALYDLVHPLDAVWMATFPADVRRQVLAGAAQTATTRMEPTQALALLAAEPELTDVEQQVLVENLALRGKLDEAEARLSNRPGLAADLGRALLSFLRGRPAAAVAAYEAALKVFLKGPGKREGLFPDRAGLFFILALIAEGSPPSLARAAVLAGAGARSKATDLEHGYSLLSEVLRTLAGVQDAEDLLYLTSERHLKDRDPLEVLIQAAAARWLHLPIPAAVRANLAERLAAAKAAGLSWYAAQASEVLASHPKNGPGVNLASLVSPRERWVETLDALTQVASPAKRGSAGANLAAAEGDHRLVWIVSKKSYGVELEPREQTRAKGTWSKGRPVALKRLFEEGKQLGFLTAADLMACKSIETYTTYEYHGRYPRQNYSLDQAKALRSLAGQPNVLIEVAE